jgi:hypothetical protein
VDSPAAVVRAAANPAAESQAMTGEEANKPGAVVVHKAVAVGPAAAIVSLSDDDDDGGGEFGNSPL